ncbi:MAG TPA: GlsB/YeaQ/YmgE family stress response membrane protein [Candidatus Dormibacteraeota bacterium]|nr:GlsB/YeaQ/YmgE family stress response membrane protein [Candidatus Dormibacteraeota bacterium]
MGLIWTILIGLVIGVVAKLVHPGRDNLGIIMTIILGIAGSLVATFLGQAIGWYEPGQAAGFVAAVIGALILLWIYGRVRGGTPA